MTAGRRAPKRAKATREQTGESCPLCRFPIKEREKLVSCGVCDAAHHEDCWDEEDGCAVPGCAGGPEPVKPPARTASHQTGEGSHVPPRAGPRGKKKRRRLTVGPEPSGEKTKTGTRPLAPGPRPLVERRLLFVGLLAVVAAFVGILLVANSNNSAPAEECEPGTGQDGIACYRNGLLPDIPKGEMRQEVGTFVRNWYRNIGQDNFGTAWQDMSLRQRQQIEQNANGRFPQGRQGWTRGMRDIARYLNPTRMQVELLEPSYPEEGVLTVNIKDTPYTDPQDRCGYRSGITWVRFDPAENAWTYEPEADLTPPRARDWSNRSASLFRNRCPS